jgi:hypothetical protein
MDAKALAGFSGRATGANDRLRGFELKSMVFIVLGKK